MELVAGVGRALAILPADGGALPGRERLGDEHVVVHRDDIAANRTHERRKRGGGEDDAPSPDPAAQGVEADAVAVRGDV
jgi:hypothetical protein